MLIKIIGDKDEEEGESLKTLPNKKNPHSQ